MTSLVGRQAMLTDLSDLLFEQNVGVLIGGAQCVGKTAVWQAITTEAHSHGVVVSVFGTEYLHSIPFGAVAPLLGQLPMSKLSKAQMLSIAVHAFLERAGDKRLFIAVDAAHQLDDKSAALIDYLLRSELATLIATTAGDRPLPAWLSDSIHLGVVRMRTLEPLSRPDTSILIGYVLGSGRVSDQVEAAVWELSQGNPFVIRQITMSAVQSGVLVCEEGTWIALNPLTPTGELSDMLDGLLAARRPEERSALEYVAMGGRVELDLLERVASDRIVIETLEEDNLIEIMDDNGRLVVRVSSASLAARIVQLVPTTRRRHINRTMARWIASKGAQRLGDTLRAATWGLDAGSNPDAQIMVRAARHALAGMNAELAERMCVSALTVRSSFEAQLTLGQSLYAQAKIEEAETALAEASELARTDVEVVRSAISRCEVFALGKADLAAATRLVAEVGGRIEDQGCLAQLRVESARLALRSGDPIEAIKISDQIESDASSAQRTHLARLVVSSQARMVIGHAAAAIDDVNEGLRLITDGAAGTWYASDQLEATKIDALLIGGRIKEAAESANAGYQHAKTSLPSGAQGLWQAITGRTALWLGDVHAARGAYAESLAELDRCDPFGSRPWLSALASVAASYGGDLEHAETLLAHACMDGSDTQIRQQVVVARASAWIMSLKGEAERAAHHGLAAAELAMTIDHYLLAAEVMHDVVRFGYAHLVTKPLATLAETVEGPLVPNYARHAAALAGKDGDELDAVSRVFNTMGAPLLAAEAARQAVTAHGSRSGSAPARRSDARASTLLTLCPGASVPALVWTEPLLTRSQNHIARLAATSSNATIAQGLHISVRTVESHLQTVYQTLGIHRRSELLDIFNPELAALESDITPP